MEIQSRLDLRIPAQKPAYNGTFLTSPKEVEAWAKSLPMANVGETSRQVFKAAVELNRLEMPAVDRMRVIEAFRSPVRYISESLKKYYFDSPLPLSPKQRKVATLNRELYAELATAYKIFISETLASKSEGFDPKLLILAIHHALWCLGRVIYHSAIVYEPVPDDVWREIHQLYAHAEQNKIHKLAIRDSKGRQEKSTIGDLYKQILLFSICAPHRLRQREMEKIFYRLPDWSGQISLRLPSVAADSACQFISRLSSDQPPAHLDLQTKVPSKRGRLLNTKKLVARLRVKFDTASASSDTLEKTEKNASKLPKYLIGQLIQTLSAAPKRQFVRTRLNFELRTTVGLTSIHALLNNRDEPETPASEERSSIDLDWLDQPARGAALYTLNKQTLSLSAMDQPIEDTLTRADSSLESGPPSDWASEENTPVPETFPCKAIDGSAGGYCINWRGANAPRIKIGQVIGIQSAPNKHQFGIGISRWMKHKPGQGLLLGMQLIAPSCTAIEVSTVSGTPQAQKAQVGLLLPELKASGQPASLMVPMHPYNAGDILWIKDATGERQIKLTQLLESTGAFAQFNFTYINLQARDNNDKDNIEDTDFDNIWPMI